MADAINAAAPGRALAVVGDVLDANYIDTLVKKTAEFGGGKIHIIINNAGFTWDGVIHKVSFFLCCVSLFPSENYHVLDFQLNLFFPLSPFPCTSNEMIDSTLPTTGVTRTVC